MKYLRYLVYCTIIASLVTVKLAAQKPAVIKIDFDRQIDTIDPNIYSAFVEPIRTVVYGSIYDPKSPFADENGFRKDFIDLVKELDIRSVRWPGGNFVSGSIGKMALVRKINDLQKGIWPGIRLRPTRWEPMNTQNSAA